MVWKSFLVPLALCVASMAQAAETAPIRVGDRAPDFSLLDVSGTTHTLSSYRGKVVLLGLVGYG